MRLGWIGLLSAAGCVGSPPRPDVILVTLDTVRADALGCYGRDPSPTPTLDRLAADGVRFVEAMSVAPFTLPSHVSIHTGRYPDRHGVRDNDGFRLDRSVPTLAAVLKGSGWQTSAFVSSAVLDARFGLDQGFDTYDDAVAVSPWDDESTLRRRPGAETVDRAISWWNGADAAPAFQWVHLYDAHLPLLPSLPWRDRFADPYDAAIAGMDHDLERLLDAWSLARPGRPRVLVVVADHGEGRGDHGEVTHGWFVYRSTMRVPLILLADGLGNRAVPGLVSTVDITPTVLELLGVAPPDDLDGVELGTDQRGRTVFGETWGPRRGFGFSELRVVQDDRFRYVLAPRSELYDWREDGSEVVDRTAADPSQADSLRSLVEARIDAWDAGGVPTRDPTIGQLATLGYVSGPWPDPSGPLRDPKDDPTLPQRVDAAITAARLRPPAEGARILERLLDQEPNAVPARRQLARAHDLGGRPDLALAALLPLVEAGPDDPDTATRQADLLLRLGRGDEAREALRRAGAAGGPVADALHAEIERRAGRCDDAIEIVERGLRQEPEAPALHLVRAACHLTADRTAEAIADLEIVLRGDPQTRDAHFLLGTAVARTGDRSRAVELFREQLRRVPGEPRTEAALGIALVEAGRPAEAVPHLDATVDDVSLGEEPPLFLAIALLQTHASQSRVDELLVLAQARRPGDPRVDAVRELASTAPR